METKEKVTDNYILENEVITETKRKKKSLIKFIHVFESDVRKRPTKAKIKRRKLNSKYMKENIRLKEAKDRLWLSDVNFGFRLFR
jgi:uncharacterized protein YjcR